MSIELKNGKTVSVSADQMQRALQYSATPGLPDLVQWIKELQIKMHARSDFEICIGNGSQEVLTKAFEMLINEGDTILIEAPAYSGTLAFLRPFGCQFAEIKTDSQGLDPADLETILANWKDPSTRPKILYTVPIGGNPTVCSIYFVIRNKGTSTTIERKKRFLYEES